MRKHVQNMGSHWKILCLFRTISYAPSFITIFFSTCFRVRCGENDTDQCISAIEGHKKAELTRKNENTVTHNEQLIDEHCQ